MGKPRQEFPDDFYEEPRVRRAQSAESKQSMIASVRPKVAAAVLAGALTTVLMYVLNEALGVEPPPEVVAAVTTLFAALGGYFQSED